MAAASKRDRVLVGSRDGKPKAEIIFAALAAAAKSGLACPSNEELGSLINGTDQTAKTRLDQLADAGRIEINCIGKARRQIRIVETGDIPAPTTRIHRRARLPKNVRPCLMCSKNFPSTGAGHRVCDGCKKTAAWRSGADIPMTSDSRHNGRLIA